MFKPNQFQKAIILILIFIWTALQPMAVMESIPFETKLRVFYWKNTTGALLVLFGLALIIFELPKRKEFNFDKNLFFLGLLFPIFVAFNNLFQQNSQSWLELVLYVLWIFALYFVFPTFFVEEEFVNITIKTFLIANTIPLFVGMWLGWSNVPFANWLDLSFRLRFDFSNPNIFAHSWQVLIPIALFFKLSWKKSWVTSLILNLIICSSFFFVIAARARSTTLFCVGVCLIYFFVDKRRPMLLRLSYTSFLLAIAIIFFSQSLTYEYEAINEVSSGRLQLWQDTIDINFSDVQIEKYIVGLTQFEVPSYMQKSIRTGFQAGRGQIDNTYLGLFLQHGLIGTLLFFLPILLMLIRMIKATKFVDTDYSMKIWLVIGCWVGIFVQGTGLAMFPSFGSVVNIFLLTITAHFYMKSKFAVNEMESKKTQFLQTARWPALNEKVV